MPLKLDDGFMQQCLILAQRGSGSVSPNPMVGAVIVRDGKIIGKGYHAKFGQAHAEVNAIKNAKGTVKGTTLYVNLEPCNFTGKTPPCTGVIISSGISRVVVGMEDPNPRVRGKGINQLRRAGIKVTVRVLHDECLRVNRAFSKYITSGLPYVTLKAAQTLDGKIADEEGGSQWISDKVSRVMTHRLRAEYDAVLVGAGTVRKDNPYLTVRHVRGRNPKRVIINPSLDLPLDANVFSEVTPDGVFVFADSKRIGQNERKIKILSARGVKFFFLSRKPDGSFSTKDILKILGEQSIASILVEGGAETIGRFVDENTADQILLFIAPKILGSGIEAIKMKSPRFIGSELKLKSISASTVGSDVLVEGMF